jgi:hypothetical protein
VQHVRGRVARHEQRRRDKTPFARRRRAAADDVGHGCELLDAREHVLLLARVRDRTQAHALVGGVTERHTRELRREVLLHVAHAVRGHEDTAHRGALLPRLLRHVEGDVRQEEAVGLRRGIDVGGQDRRVERVGLDVDAHVVPHEVRVRADDRAGCRGARERDAVLAVQVVEQVPGAAAQELERALRHEPRLDDDVRDAPRDERRRSGGFLDHRDTGEPRARGLLHHPPRGEVVGIDVHGDTAARHADVLAPETSRAAELQAVAVGEERALAEALAERRVGGEGPRGPVDVELAVAAGVAAVRRREVEQLVPVRVDRRRDRLEHLRALRKGHGAQRGTADLAPVAGDGGHVDPLRRGPRDDLVRGRVRELRALPRAALPGAAHVAVEDLHRRVPGPGETPHGGEHDIRRGPAEPPQTGHRRGATAEGHC